MLRSLAFGWLARPAELLALLLEHAEQDDTPPAPHPDDLHADPEHENCAPEGPDDTGDTSTSPADDKWAGHQAVHTVDDAAQDPTAAQPAPQRIRGYPTRP